MIDYAELRSSRPGEAYLNALIDVLCRKNVCGNRRRSPSIGREETPRLATKDFPFALTKVHPAKTNAQTVAVGRDGYIAWRETGKIRFDQSQEVGVPVMYIESRT